MPDRARILIVDDEDYNRKLISGILTRQNYSIAEASNGEEALKQVEKFSPDLLLLDIKMPGMSGFDVAKRLKANDDFALIPIVMVTALSTLGHKAQALELGVDDFLTKPINVAELIARVRSLLKVRAYYKHMKNYQMELEIEVEKRTEQLRRSMEKIKAASLDTINRLSMAAEYKDEDTGAHIQRMSNYAAAVARRIGLKDQSVQAILYAAPMHDLGKIGIPDRILLKPGKLEPDEWKIMKQHTTIGAQILNESSSAFIRLGKVIALTHHEKWDGTGYPYGLKGKEIPLTGRIVAIADVFDALISKRPYKEPFSLEKSFAILEENSGAHFDPEVVRAFFTVKDEILLYKNKYHDSESRRKRRMTPFVRPEQAVGLDDKLHMV